MMGHNSNEVKRILRLYMVIHADHEGGNITAHTAHLVASGLSNPYYCLRCCYARPGRPIAWLCQSGYHQLDMYDMIDELGTDEPDPKKILSSICRKTIREGRVIPGYGHAVLQKTDPQVYRTERIC
jgi:citrate synthase